MQLRAFDGFFKILCKARIRPSSPPDGHDQGIGDQLRHHVGIHGPAHDTTEEQVNDGNNIEPALGCPDVGEVGNPFLVWPVRLRLTI